jgi:hypothetical protein
LVDKSSDDASTNKDSESVNSGGNDTDRHGSSTNSDDVHSDGNGTDRHGSTDGDDVYPGTNGDDVHPNGSGTDGDAKDGNDDGHRQLGDTKGDHVLDVASSSEDEEVASELPTVQRVSVEEHHVNVPSDIPAQPSQPKVVAAHRLDVIGKDGVDPPTDGEV